jgi:prevent-host-death family protein
MRTNLYKLVDRAAAGEEIIIAKAGKPKAKLVPYQPAQKRGRFGQDLLGITYIADDLDAPLPPELQNYFEQVPPDAFDGDRTRADAPRDTTLISTFFGDVARRVGG